jgi:hypothetical protein
LEEENKEQEKSKSQRKIERCELKDPTALSLRASFNSLITTILAMMLDSWGGGGKLSLSLYNFNLHTSLF